MLPRWVYWGLFLESLEKFSGPKSQLSNYNPLVLKSWCLNITFLKDCEVWWLRTSALRRYKGNRGTRNRPEKIPDSWETGAWWERKTAKTQGKLLEWSREVGIERSDRRKVRDVVSRKVKILYMDTALIMLCFSWLDFCRNGIENVNYEKVSWFYDK